MQRSKSQHDGQEEGQAEKVGVALQVSRSTPRRWGGSRKYLRDGTKGAKTCSPPCK